MVSQGGSLHGGQRGVVGTAADCRGYMCSCPDMYVSRGGCGFGIAQHYHIFSFQISRESLIFNVISPNF